MVPAPSFLTFASHDVRTLNSRSVAVMVTRPSRASTSRFDRIGIVVLRSTTPCVVVSSFNRADLLTLNSIAWLSSRTVPVADIYTFLRNLIRCCVLYSFFAPGERLTNVIVLVEVWKLVGNFARLICPLPGQTNSARKFHSYNHNNKRFFFVFLLLSKNKFIPCCDDERCESVEFSATSARSSDCDKGVLWVDCVYLGYFPDIAAPSASCGFFILTLQQ